MPYVSGLGSSAVVFAIGAILDFAVKVQTSSINLHTVGLILMIVGVVGFVVAAALGIAASSRSSYRRTQRVSPDGNGGTYVEEQGVR